MGLEINCDFIDLCDLICGSVEEDEEDEDKKQENESDERWEK